MQQVPLASTCLSHTAPTGPIPPVAQVAPIAQLTPTPRVDPLAGEVSFASVEEQEQRSVELLGAGALLVRLPPPTPHVRGHLGALLEELVERELARSGAPSPYLAAWTAMPDEANARLTDQLLRAEAVGASGLAIALGTLAHIALPSLCPDDSAVLRWLADAATALPLVLLLDDSDLHLSGYAAPKPLMDLLARAEEPDAAVLLTGSDATAVETAVAVAPFDGTEHLSTDLHAFPDPHAASSAPDANQVAIGFAPVADGLARACAPDGHAPVADTKAGGLARTPAPVANGQPTGSAPAGCAAVDVAPIDVGPVGAASVDGAGESEVATRKVGPRTRRASATALLDALTDPRDEFSKAEDHADLRDMTSGVAATAEPTDAGHGAARARRMRTARSAVAGAIEVTPHDVWRGWALALAAARGAQPLAAFEKLFAESYVPLANAIANGLDDPRAMRAFDEFRRAFERSYTDAFAAFGATNRRPRLVMDAFDLALRQARLVGARSAHVLLVDSMRFDLGAMVRDHLARETSGSATLVSETMLWSALPTTTMRQLETLARGMDAIRAPAAEEPSESLRGRAAEVVRRFRLGSREVYKLDLVPSMLDAAGANALAELPAIGHAVAETVARHLTTLAPRTLLFIVGDHGFSLDRRGQIQTGGASPEEVLVPAQAWLVGDLH